MIGTRLTAGLDDLKNLCSELNDAITPWNPELRRLLTVWQQSGPNLKAMLEADRKLKKELETEFLPVIVPTETGRAYVYLNPRPITFEAEQPMPSEVITRIARSYFMVVTLSPACDKFGGPCPRCQRFFIRKTAKRSVYCSRRCASQHSAIEATIKARAEQRKSKLARAERAMAEWEQSWKKGRTRKTWKEWVAASDPDITVRFLTRAINERALQPPAIGSESHKRRNASAKAR